jgi:hypothetical protein
MGATQAPLVSVVLPTFGRPAFLARAVESVLAQSCGDFELVVSDDEREAGESREYLLAVAARDARVRVIVHEGPPGQAGNMNAAMRAARGAWIKPLHDDDELLPACLERMLDAAGRHRRAVLVRSLGQRIGARGGLRRATRGRRAALEAIPGPDALLAMLVQDVEIGPPTYLMVRRDVVHAGCWFPTHPALRGGLDELWCTHLLRHGDLLLLNEVLAIHHQGGHESITSGLTPEEFDREMMVLRREQLPIVQAARPSPGLGPVLDAMLIERALWRLTHGHAPQALRMLARSYAIEGWALAIRWALRRLLPGRFELVRRVPISG